VVVCEGRAQGFTIDPPPLEITEADVWLEKYGDASDPDAT
jgi:hypothetical protein